MKSKPDMSKEFVFETSAGKCLVTADSLCEAATLCMNRIKRTNKEATSAYGFRYGQVRKAHGVESEIVAVASKEYDSNLRAHFIRYMDGSKDWIFA